MIIVFKNRRFEKLLAGLSLLAAISLSLLGLLLNDPHDVGSMSCFVIAQFLTLTATLLGLDYKFNPNGSNPAPRPPQQ